jgi:hypothetical protein
VVAEVEEAVTEVVVVDVVVLLEVTEVTEVVVVVVVALVVLPALLLLLPPSKAVLPLTLPKSMTLLSHPLQLVRPNSLAGCRLPVT